MFCGISKPFINLGIILLIKVVNAPLKKLNYPVQLVMKNTELLAVSLYVL